MARKIKVGSDVLYHGDCIEVMRSLEDASFDVILTDPPYAEIDRDYGRLTEKDWHKLINAAMVEFRRLLKPKGSAVLILQPNGKAVGQMRPWLWEFMAKWTREWNMIQDVWWWNVQTLPGAWSTTGYLRGSVKVCAWFGPADCTRHLDRVSIPPAKSMNDFIARFERGNIVAERLDEGMDAKKVRIYHPSGHGVDRRRMAELSKEKGVVRPMNMLPFGNGSVGSRGGDFGHGAATPMPLVEWWLRYLAPDNARVLDPFVGSGTVPIVARMLGHTSVGIDKMEKNVETSRARLKTVQPPPKPLFK